MGGPLQFDVRYTYLALAGIQRNHDDDRDLCKLPIIQGT